MTRLLSIIISFLIGRAAHSDQHQSTGTGLIKLPMLLLRRITQLWLTGLGVLLIGVVGVALLLLEVSQQLQLQHFVTFTASMGMSLVVIGVSLLTCTLILRRDLWTSSDERNSSFSKAKEPAGQPDLTTVLALLAKDFLDERTHSRELKKAQMQQASESAVAMNVAELRPQASIDRSAQSNAAGGHIN